jgi:glycosyltransferase involved in cell wall biosynthesis
MENVTNNPLVSIIVRTKDRPKLLRRALQSIAAQDYRPLEVVLVNDGGCSLDIEELRGVLGDIFLNYIRLEENTGRAHAGNVGIENVRGEYVGFLDDDDEFYPEHLQVLTGQFTDGSLQIAYADAEMVFVEIDEENNYREKSRLVPYSQDFSPGTMLVQNYIPFMCLLFRREALDSVRFDERFEMFEDWRLLIELSRKFWFAHVKKITAVYVQWSNQSQINRRALVEEFSGEAYKQILSQNIDRITPEIIYQYCVNNATEKMRLVEEGREKGELLERLQAEKARIKDERNHLLERFEAEKARSEDERNHLLERFEAEKARSEDERNHLLERFEAEKARS